MRTISKRKALANFLNIKKSEISEGHDENTFDTSEGEFMVLTESEANEKAEEYIKDSLWAFKASFILNFTNVDYSVSTEKAFTKLQSELCEDANEIVLAMIGGENSISEFTETAIEADGRGHFLSSYDGEEIEQDDYYIYRTN